MGSSRRSGDGLRAGASSPTKLASTLTRPCRKAMQSLDSGYYEFLLATQVCRRTTNRLIPEAGIQGGLTSRRLRAHYRHSRSSQVRPSHFIYLRHTSGHCLAATELTSAQTVTTILPNWPLFSR